MKQILKNTWAILNRKEKREFATLIIADIIISVVDILSLALLLWIVHFYIQPDQPGRLPFLHQWLASKNSLLYIVIFFLLFGLKNGMGYFISRTHFQFIGTVAIRLSRNNLINYQQSGMEEFVNVDSSAQIRKICLQPFEFCQYMLSGIQQIITQLFLILITVVAILLFDARLFLLLLVILLPPVIAVFYFIKKRLTTTKRNIQSSNEKSFQYVLDALKGYVESNIYIRNEFFLRRFIDSRKIFSKHLFDSLALQTMPSRIIEIFAILGLFILIAIAKWTGNDDSAALLTIGAFMAAAYKIIPGIVKIINISGQMKAYEFAVTDLEPGNKTLPVDQPANHIGPLRSLTLKNVQFRYGDLPVLNNISLTLNKGELIGITGKSGAGKTTIFNLILGFLAPASGQILLNDQPAKINDLKECWPSISYVRQQPFFIHDTLLKNITFEETGHNEKNLKYALEMSGLKDLINLAPDGLEKVISENGKNISGGQQQRVAIARALYKKAELILLDEPFNELDELSTISLLEHFHQLSREGKMVVMITHDKKSLAYCDKILSLDDHD